MSVAGPQLGQQASTSSQPNITTPATYHPQPRPQPLPPFQRIDIHPIKQELHDVLGENGLPYWKALNGYLLGQVGREEMAGMVKGWLKGKHVHLHNRLLSSLLYNASAPPASIQSPALANLRKRRRLDVNDPEFDIDDSKIESKNRVQTWVMGIPGRERARIRRAVINKADEGGMQGSGPDGDLFDPKRKRLPHFAPTTAMPPLAASDRQLPSSHQLGVRLSQLAKAYDLTLAPDASSEIGEFMAIGLDAYLGDVLHGTVRMTGHDRPGQDTVRIPKGVKQEQQEHSSTVSAGDVNMDGRDGEDVVIKQEREIGEDLPKPDISTLHHLFNLVPELHQQASPALYKLATSQTLAEAEYNETKPKIEKQTSPPLPPLENGHSRAALTSTSPKAHVVRPVSTAIKAELVQQHLLENGLLRIDKAGREEGESSKKDKKHTLHWKYEDPAMILRDVLG